MKCQFISQLPTKPGHGQSLYCDHCGARYSACRGDYFMAAPDARLPKCCGKRTRLVQFRVVIDTVGVSVGP